MFMDALASKGLTPSSGWGFEPIQTFGRYEFTDPKQAAEFMGSRNFTNFWGKGNVDSSNVAARVEYQTKGRYSLPRFSPNQITTDLSAANTRYLNAVNDPLILSLNGEENLRNRLNYTTTGIRAEGRFYTPVDEKTALAGYMSRGQSRGDDLPIRVVADERVSRSSLKGNDRFSGWTSAEGTETHQAGMGAEGARRNLTRVTGRNLGAALSSNPSEEVFLPSNMARPASQGGSSRVAGRITDAGKIVLQGMPKTSVPLQMLGNVNRIGGAVLERAAAPISLGMQVYGATSDDQYDREYGHPDPFSSRPLWDFMGKITGMYEDQNSNTTGVSIPQAWREMRSQISDPAWIERNKTGAIPYNMIMNPSEFAQGMKDAYVPLWKKAANTPSEVSTFVGF
jgi:hypothetical protein